MNTSLLADNGQEQWSPYAAMGNNPGMMVDPMGTQFSASTDRVYEDYLPHGEFLRGIAISHSVSISPQDMDGATLVRMYMTGAFNEISGNVSSLGESDALNGGYNRGKKRRCKCGRGRGGRSNSSRPPR